MGYRSALFAFFLFAAIASGNVSAYFNTTYLSTTVYLTNSTSARVVEGVQLYISNSSVSTYNQDRQAFNLSLTKWVQVTGSQFLVQHILNPKASFSNFTFLPGPITPAGNGGGYASMQMIYIAHNVTSVVSTAPRQFEYSFNSSAFNFVHTASGESLSPNTRLIFMLPNDTSVVNIFPLPDSPQPNSAGKYSGTSFSWYSGEPLQNFNFVYIITETPQQEVVRYFSDVYNNYTGLVYLAGILIVVAIVAYIYFRVFR